MKTDENYRGARHRTLILLYITWLTLSLAPAMLAPPQRSFQQGQPEMQQSMDNMVMRKTVVQKRTNNSPKDEDQEVNQMKFQEVSFKTSKLLAEAEKVLKALPDTKERKWIESFVERMREIAKMLEKSAQHKNLAKDFDSMKGAPVPDGLPKQLTQHAPSAVPEINPFQKPISTSPEISRVLPEDGQSENQAVTKPVALSNKVDETESDELVRELESLHEEKTHKGPLFGAKAIHQGSATTTHPTPSTKMSSENHKETLVNAEAETEKLKARLIEEIEEFHRRGGVMPKEVLDILNADGHKITDPARRKLDINEEMKFTASGMKDRRGMMGLNNLNSEDKEISMASMRNMPPYAAHQFPYFKINHTFPNKHPNFVQGFPHLPGHYFQNSPSLYKAQSYQGRPQNMDPNFQKINPYSQGKYQDLGMLHQQGHNPDALKQKLFKPHISYNGRMPQSDYHNYYMRQNLSPYPYMHNWNPQNSTFHLPQMMPPYTNNRGKIDVNVQLSDEMKRELRDGKIIVLSDSVVRSNFQPENSKKTTQSITDKPELQQVEMKNETTAEN